MDIRQIRVDPRAYRQKYASAIREADEDTGCTIRSSYRLQHSVINCQNSARGMSRKIVEREPKQEEAEAEAQSTNRTEQRRGKKRRPISKQQSWHSPANNHPPCRKSEMRRRRTTSATDVQTRAIRTYGCRREISAVTTWVWRTVVGVGVGGAPCVDVVAGLQLRPLHPVRQQPHPCERRNSAGAASAAARRRGELVV
jgi:hypothetical protein